LQIYRNFIWLGSQCGRVARRDSGAGETQSSTVAIANGAGAAAPEPAEHYPEAPWYAPAEPPYGPPDEHMPGRRGDLQWRIAGAIAERRRRRRRAAQGA